MKKIKIFIICICIIITSKAFASDLFLTPSFWQTATQKEIFASIDNGENINIETENGLTAVALALSESNNPNIFDILIEKGVKINTNDDATVIKLNFAAKKNKNTLVHENFMKTMTRLHMLKRNLRNENFYKKATLEDIKTTIKDGANYNEESSQGITPFMIASSSVANPEIIDHLIKQGADLNKVDEFNSNALLWAIGSNPNIKVIEVLLKNTPNTNRELLIKNAQISPNKNELIKLFNEMKIISNTKF